jgi:hypothetical protein
MQVGVLTSFLFTMAMKSSYCDFVTKRRFLHANNCIFSLLKIGKRDALHAHLRCRSNLGWKILHFLCISLISLESVETLDEAISVQEKNRIVYQAPNIPWQRSMRSKVLESIDKILSWTFDQRQYPYILRTPFQKEEFRNEDPLITSFTREFGYFSQEHPLVGKVTGTDADIKITLQLLEAIDAHIKNPHQRIVMTAEVLTKVLAYRDLKRGQLFRIPMASSSVLFEVDTLFDLGDGMPAFGFIPKEGNAAPFLLFRGTDLSLLSQRGLASLISDFDPKGPGLTAFKRGRIPLHQWLEKVSKGGPKAVVLGYSLGGALAAYTLLFEHDLINSTEPSYLFNPPGVSRKIFKQWKKLSREKQPIINLFVAKGDLISKIGRLFGNIYELSTPKLLYPIAAHVTLISTSVLFYQYEVDLIEENHSHRF